MRQNSRYDVIVLGNGIAGLGCALALARYRKKVLMIGKKQMHGEATQASAGILDPLLDMNPKSPLLRLGLEAFANYPSLIKRLYRETSVSTDYAATGILYTASSKSELNLLVSSYKWQRRQGISVQWMNRADLSKNHPDLSGNILAALFYPKFGKINPRKLKKAFLKWNRKLGVDVLESHQEATALTNQKKIEGVQLGHQKFLTSHVINAMGSWSGKHDLAGLSPPVVPVRGQILLVSGKHHISPVIHSPRGMYVVPWKSNQLLLGTTVEFVGFRPKVTSQGLRDIRRSAQALVPGLRQMKFKTSWAGLRPFPKDSLPIIGPGGFKGLYFATGYYRSGILIGAYAGELLAKGIVSGKMPRVLKPFHPMRFNPS